MYTVQGTWQMHVVWSVALRAELDTHLLVYLHIDQGQLLVGELCVTNAQIRLVSYSPNLPVVRQGTGLEGWRRHVQLRNGVAIGTLGDHRQ